MNVVELGKKTFEDPESLKKILTLFLSQNANNVILISLNEVKEDSLALLSQKIHKSLFTKDKSSLKKEIHELPPESTRAEHLFSFEMLIGSMVSLFIQNQGKSADVYSLNQLDLFAENENKLGGNPGEDVLEENQFLIVPSSCAGMKNGKRIILNEMANPGRRIGNVVGFDCYSIFP